MKKYGLSKKELILSILTTAICHVALMLMMMLTLIINVEGQILNFLNTEINNVITVIVALSILSIIMYSYFLVENKAVIAKCSKIIEIYVLLGIALILNVVIGKFRLRRARCCFSRLWPVCLSDAGRRYF